MKRAPSHRAGRRQGFLVLTATVSLPLCAVSGCGGGTGGSTKALDVQKVESSISTFARPRESWHGTKTLVTCPAGQKAVTGNVFVCSIKTATLEVDGTTVVQPGDPWTSAEVTVLNPQGQVHFHLEQ